jgi:hypothetical protein
MTDTKEIKVIHHLKVFYIDVVPVEEEDYHVGVDNVLQIGDNPGAFVIQYDSGTIRVIDRAHIWKFNVAMKTKVIPVEESAAPVQI